jgi:hypothetical protein
MATRADKQLENALIVTRTVETAQTVVVGRVVKDGNADHECQHTGAGENGFGVVVALGKLEGAAGDKVSIATLGGGIIVPVKVGTGGATRGSYAKSVSDGVTNATPAAAATGTSVYVHGIFMQSGVAADVVGMLAAPGWVTEA